MGRGTGLLLCIPAHSLLLLFLPMNSLTSTVSSVHLTLCIQRGEPGFYSEDMQTPMQLCFMVMARATGTCGMPSKKHAACLLFSSRHQSQRQRFCMETSDSKLSTPHATRSALTAQSAHSTHPQCRVALFAVLTSTARETVWFAPLPRSFERQMPYEAAAKV